MPEARAVVRGEAERIALGVRGAWRVLGREPRGAGDADATWPARDALGGGRRSEWASDVAR